MVLLDISGLEKNEATGFAVRDIQFTQEIYQNIAIVGETGSGKTSLLKMIAGLLQPDKGTILFQGERVKGPLEKLLPGHPGIAYLSQHFELRNNYRVEEELESKNLLPETAANRIYDICRIGHLKKRRTDQLSGGERQRIVLARLLTTSPGLLLLDEPFSNLDRLHKQIIKEVLKDLVEKLHITCILVSHDAADALSWAERILVMRDGRIIQDGKPEMIYEQPADVYCAGLLGEYNLLDDRLAAVFLEKNRKAVPGKQWMVRPEKFRTGKPGEGQVDAQITAVSYCGSHYRVSMQAEKQEIIVRMNKRTAVGDWVGLSLSAADGWFV
ncbi:MAG: ABC transporter ATP-binding protein [Sphingobacteriales bacterium]|nr:ABC transporter ATP-binding protein [Sphingobacteriales bacterium]